MVVAADDMGDAHVVIVDDDGQHVGRRAVRAQQDHVVEILVREHDAALHAVVDHGLAVARRFAGGSTGATPAGASAGSRSRQGPSIARRPALGASPRRASPRAPPASGSSDRPGRAASSSSRHLGVALARANWNTARRPSRAPSQFRPSMMASIAASVERSRSVSSMRSRNLPPVWRAIEPVEQRRAGAADMQEAGRRGGEAGDDLAVSRIAGIGHGAGALAGER